MKKWLTILGLLQVIIAPQLGPGPLNSGWSALEYQRQLGQQMTPQYAPLPPLPPVIPPQTYPVQPMPYSYQQPLGPTGHTCRNAYGTFPC